MYFLKLVKYIYKNREKVKLEQRLKENSKFLFQPTTFEAHEILLENSDHIYQLLRSGWIWHKVNF